MFTAHLHLVLRLRMNGAIPLLPAYAFVVWTRKTVTLLYFMFIPFIRLLYQLNWALLLMIIRMEYS